VRLQLTAAALCLFLGATASAGGKASTRVDVYTDGDIDVVVPAVLGGWDGEHWEVEGRYVADVISGATPVWTPDLITSATTFSEVRHAGGLATTWKPSVEQRVTANYDTSVEPDYLTHAGSGRYAIELFERSSTFGLGYGLSAETLGKVDDDTLAERTTTHRVDLSWDQIVGRTTTGGAVLTTMASRCGERFGCLANPYRFVDVDLEDAGPVALNERNPDRLYRAALGGRLSQAIGSTAAVHGGYRFYADSWRITGHTVDLGTKATALEERLLVGLNSRFSTQTPASFFRDAYSGRMGSAVVPMYRTGDRELSGLGTVQFGGRAGWTFYAPGPFLDLKVSSRLVRAWYRYPRSTALPVRAAWLGGGGVDATF